MEREIESIERGSSEGEVLSEKLGEIFFPGAEPIEHWERRYPPRELSPGVSVTRFAPSPTGFLHVGGAVMAMINEAEAKRTDGVFILRIEDTDRTRSVAGAEEAIYAGLEWLGIHPTEGGRENQGSYAPYRQSERLAVYRSYVKELVRRGHAYPCFCSEEKLKELREEQVKEKQLRMYPGTCRNLESGEVERNIRAGKSFVIRMRIPKSEVIEWRDLAKKSAVRWNSGALDDQVLLKSDGFPTYHLANVVDDHLMGVNHVYRGEEWLSSTPKHLLLYRYFGWQPPEFAHLVLLRKQGTEEKLSKREGEAGLEWYRMNGYPPEAVKNFLTRTLWAHPKDLDIYPHDDFVKGFDVSKLGDSAPQVNFKLLDRISQLHLARLTPEERYKKILEWASLYDNELAQIFTAHEKEAKEVLGIEPERMKKLSEARTTFGFYFDELYAAPARGECLKEVGGDREKLSRVLLGYHEKYCDTPSSQSEWEQKVRQAAQEFGVKDKSMFMLIRLVLTGSRYSPPLFKVLEGLSESRVKNRFAAFLKEWNLT